MADTRASSNCLSVRRFFGHIASNPFLCSPPHRDKIRYTNHFDRRTYTTIYGVGDRALHLASVPCPPTDITYRRYQKWTESIKSVESIRRAQLFVTLTALTNSLTSRFLLHSWQQNTKCCCSNMFN